MKKNSILSMTLLFSLMFIQNIKAISVPSTATKDSIVQYTGQSFNVLKGQLIGNDTIEYDIKEDDILTYSDDNSINKIYSKYDITQSVPGYIMGYLYKGIPFAINPKNQYLFKEKTDEDITFKNETTDSQAIYTKKVIEYTKANEIVTSYSLADKKFNTIYRVNNKISQKLIKTSSNHSVSIKDASEQGVYYEPQN